MRKPETMLMSAIFYTSYGKAFNDDDLEESNDGVSLREAISSVIAALSSHTGNPKFRSRVKRVIEARFGFDSGHGRTLAEVGQEFGLTRERIRQIEMKGLRCLRHPVYSRVLRPYIREGKQ